MLYEKVLEKYKTKMGQSTQSSQHTQQQQQQTQSSQATSNTSAFLQPPKLEKSFDSSPRYTQQQQQNMNVSMNRVGYNNNNNSLMDMDMNSNDNNNNNNNTSKSKMIKMGMMSNKDYTQQMDMNNANAQVSSFFMNNQMMDQLYMETLLLMAW
jgi:hypothetical protein